MTTDNKPPMFGPSALFDLATCQPSAGKSFVLQQALRRLPPSSPLTAELVLSNCNTEIFLSGLPMLARDVLLGLESLKAKVETTGISLWELSKQIGMAPTARSYKALRDALEGLIAQNAVCGLRYCEEDGLVKVCNS